MESFCCRLFSCHCVLSIVSPMGAFWRGRTRVITSRAAVLLCFYSLGSNNPEFHLSAPGLLALSCRAPRMARRSLLNAGGNATPFRHRALSGALEYLEATRDCFGCLRRKTHMEIGISVSHPSGFFRWTRCRLWKLACRPAETLKPRHPFATPHRAW